MELEAVGRVSVRDLSFQVCRQIDDSNGTEWAFLWANTTTNAETLGDEGEAGVGRDFDAKLAAAHDRARLLTFLSAFLARESCEQISCGIMTVAKLHIPRTFGLHCDSPNVTSSQS
jgi:hypothetical protein